LRNTRETIAAALSLLEDMERREEMAASLRARGVREAMRALGGRRESPSADVDADRASGPESSVEVVGTHDLEWDMDIAESE
jgi:hypothetical protein